MSVTTTMKNSWLVQRLRPPLGRPNPFAFGGGMVNGGLSNEAMAALVECFSFDYMGAAEYEHGAVPDALRRLSAGGVVARSTKVDGSELFILCPPGSGREVTKRITAWAKGNGKTRDRLLLIEALRGETDVCGWLELDNGFFFFTDLDMWRRTASLFGIQVEDDS